MTAPGRRWPSGACLAREYAVLDAFEGIEMRLHLDMKCRQVDDIAEIAAGFGEDDPQILPAGFELRLGILDDAQILGASDLSGAIERPSDLERRRVAVLLEDARHARRNDGLAQRRHCLLLLLPVIHGPA